jgi:hypothetical protein
MARYRTSTAQTMVMVEQAKSYDDDQQHNNHIDRPQVRKISRPSLQSERNPSKYSELAVKC